MEDESDIDPDREVDRSTFIIPKLPELSKRVRAAQNVRSAELALRKRIEQARRIGCIVKIEYCGRLLDVRELEISTQTHIGQPVEHVA